MDTYRFCPAQKPLHALLFSFSCAAAGLIVFALSAYLQHRFWLLSILALALLSAAVWFPLRFAIISYRYELRGDVFYVVRCMGKYQRVVCNLSLRTVSAVVPRDSKAARQSFPVPRRIYNYTTVWPSEHTQMLYYRDAKFTCAILLENNEAFIEILKSKVPVS